MYHPVQKFIYYLFNDSASNCIYSHTSTYVICPQTQYIKPSVQICRHDAEDVFELVAELP